MPLYSPDYDDAYPPEAIALKEAIGRSDAVLFVTPEYNRSIPGALKNAIDWASRPWGQNSFDHTPVFVAEVVSIAFDHKAVGIHPTGVTTLRASPCNAGQHEWVTGRGHA